MTTTRSGKESTSQESVIDQAAGTKHDIDDKTAPASKRTKQDDEKEQKTLEETLPR